MRVAILARQVMPEGGLSLSAFRLARVLAEQGSETFVVYGEGEPPSGFAELGKRVPQAGEGVAPARLSAALERLDPAAVLVGTGLPADLRAAAAVAPTALHAHLHAGVCADRSRYWTRLRRPCSVRAGWRCAALRPLLGCADRRQAFDPGPIRAQREILASLAAGELGVLCVSTDQAELYRRHGVPVGLVAVLPNLGLRAEPEELAAAAGRTPAEWRRATAFFGRLSKPKGAQLLARLSAELPEPARLRVFGEGYLGPELAGRLPAGVLCGQVSQEEVAGILMWARAVAFPSLWPEPGGIVGVDAQVMGVPLSAFDVGAARHWPAAERLPPGDVEAMARSLLALGEEPLPRDPEAVAAAQGAYWERIGERAAGLLAALAARGEFAGVGGEAPAESLISAPARSRDGSTAPPPPARRG